MNQDDLVNNIPMRIVGFNRESAGKTRYEQMGLSNETRSIVFLREIGPVLNSFE